MDFREFCGTLARRWRFLVACVLIGACAAVAVNLLKEPTYTAKAQLFVATSDKEGANAYQGSLFSQQRVKSYTKFLESPSVLNGVIAKLDLQTTPEKLARHISAKAPLDTAVVEIAVTDHSARQAGTIANETAAQFTRFIADVEKPADGGEPLVKVSTVQFAEQPRSPTSPQPALNLAIGLLCGLVVGVGGALLRETFDTTVRSAGDLSDGLGLPTLGVIAHGSQRRRALPAARDSQLAEDFNHLRTALQFIDDGRTPKCVLITSATDREGKTATAVELMTSFARAGRHVILVECDLRRPRLAEYLGASSSSGLTSVLTGRSSLSDALQQWSVEEAGLSGEMRILPGGPVPQNPGELLASSDFEIILHTLTAAADIVLLDGPAVLPFADSPLLATRSDGVLLVVRARKTKRDAVHEALAKMNTVNARVFGAVLTASGRVRSARRPHHRAPDPGGTGSRPSHRAAASQRGAGHGMAPAGDGAPEHQGARLGNGVRSPG